MYIYIYIYIYTYIYICMYINTCVMINDSTVNSAAEEVSFMAVCVEHYLHGV